MTILDANPPLAFYLASVGTLLIGVWKLWLKPKLEAKRPFPGVPTPSPTCHWLYGHMGLLTQELQTASEGVFDSVNTNGRIGIWMLHWPVLAVTHWEDAKQILMTEHHHDVNPVVAKHLRKFLGPNNIGLLNDRLWKYERSIILRSLSPKVLHSAQDSIVQVAQRLVDSLKARIGQDSSYTTDVEPLMKMMTLDIFGVVAFSRSFGCCDNLSESTVAAAFSYLSAELNRRLQTKPAWPSNLFYSWPNFANRKHASQSKVLRRFIADRIAERRDDAPPDLLTALLQAHGNLAPEKTHGILMEDLLSDVLMSLIFAGYDTTSIMLTYMLYNMTHHPAIYQECVKEVDAVGVTNTSQLVYCRAVLQETLRLYPPAFTTQRCLQKAVTLADGYVVPAKTMVLAPIWSIHRSEHNFLRAGEFLPSRWVKRDGDGNWQTRSYKPDQEDCCLPGEVPAANPEAFFAFSGGARSCPGQSFAWQEALIIMAHLLRDLRFATAPGYVLQPNRNGIVQHPKGGLPLVISLRSHEL
jgi:cytochrome P450